MRDIALRDVLVLAICVVLIGGGALFYFTGRSGNQERVSLEPIKAVPMRVPNASDSTPPTPAPVKIPGKLEPRAVTPQASTSNSTTSSSTSASSTTSSKPSPSSTTPGSDASRRPDATSDSSASAVNSQRTGTDTAVPEPSERPSDATLPSTDSAADSSTTATVSTVAATPPALPVRNSAQGWAVQAGAFKNALNATNLRDRLLKQGLAARVETGADGVNRVLVGAYSSNEAAKAASATVATALK